MTLEEIKEEIANHQSVIPMVDGQSLKYNLFNRAYGFGHLAFGAFCAWKVPYVGPVIGGILAADGIGDLFTGKHHYFAFRLFKAHPKYEIKKLQAQLENEPTSD